LGTYSFNGNKIITTSGGGMLVSSEPEYVAKARFLATQARDQFPYYHHTQIGYNYRMSNVLAGIGRGQLKVLEDRVAARRQIYGRYRERLSTTPALQWMPDAPFGRSTHWLSACTIDPATSDVDARELIEVLSRARIEARRIWKPMHSQPLFTECRYYPHAEGLSVSDDLFARGVCLPSGSNLTTDQQDRIINVIEDVFSQHQVESKQSPA
jgi:pyridoxal phosphate-dependent aminotransferase EpsN